MNRINVSLVLYNTRSIEIQRLLRVLRSCSLIDQIYLIDNSESISTIYKSLDVQYIYNNRNIGYGAGHNIAIEQSIKRKVKYHLVINSDIILNENTLIELYAKMESDKLIGIIMPKILNTDSSVQLLPKLLPTPFDLLLRVIKPFKMLFSLKSKQYTLEQYSDQELNVPIISGCFSLFRIEALKNVGSYDENFFMYFEDFDLSRRIHSSYNTIYFPSVAVIHKHERGASKSTKLFLTFIISAVKYFNKYGWYFDRERKKINNTVLSSLK